MNIGKAIKFCRHIKNLDQSELAKKAGISISYLCIIESGKRNPRFDLVGEIARALDVPMGILTFMASEESDLEGLPIELKEKLSREVLLLVHQ